MSAPTMGDVAVRRAGTAKLDALRARIRAIPGRTLAGGEGLVLLEALEAMERDSERLDYLLEDDPRFRRFPNNTWAFETPDGDVVVTPSPRECVDVARAAVRP